VVILEFDESPCESVVGILVVNVTPDPLLVGLRCLFKATRLAVDIA
jgi:hypothetical protein